MDRPGGGEREQDHNQGQGEWKVPASRKHERPTGQQMCRTTDRSDPWMKRWRPQRALRSVEAKEHGSGEPVGIRE